MITLIFSYDKYRIPQRSICSAELVLILPRMISTATCIRAYSHVTNISGLPIIPTYYSSVPPHLDENFWDKHEVSFPVPPWKSFGSNIQAWPQKTSAESQPRKTHSFKSEKTMRLCIYPLLSLGYNYVGTLPSGWVIWFTMIKAEC